MIPHHVPLVCASASSHVFKKVIYILKTTNKEIKKFENRYRSSAGYRGWTVLVCNLEAGMCQILGGGTFKGRRHLFPGKH